MAMLEHTQQHTQYDQYAEDVPTAAADGQQGCGPIGSWR